MSEIAEPEYVDLEAEDRQQRQAAIARATNKHDPDMDLPMLAMAKDLDIEKLRALLEFKNIQEDRAAKKAFNEAMAKCVAEFPSIARDSKNAQTSSTYAKLEAISAAITPVLSRNGFSVTCRAIPDKSTPTHKRIQLIVRHSGGHVDDKTEDDFPIQTTGLKGGAMMTEMHARGSVYTYAERYMKVAYFGLTIGGQDNDGQEVIGPAQIEIINKLADAVQKVDPKWEWKRFLAWLKCESLETMTAVQFAKAVADLNSRRKA